MNRMLILALLPVALSATANCVTDPPEIGDIGPGSVLVCKELAHSFPSAALAVEGRSIHSPTEVTVMASVDGRPIPLSYTLAGFTWSFNDGGTRTADATAPRSGPSIPH